ncbi:hypothetical protein F5Y05DRAFT_406417 [Hypoxylon sp. FL0543]|nr:hypothetical protein F5Y05DRAFT_406417 [Hypoxylon sp. FL0543]
MVVDIKLSSNQQVFQMPSDIFQSLSSLVVEWDQMEKDMTGYLKDERSSPVQCYTQDKLLTIETRYKRASLALQSFKAAWKNDLPEVRRSSTWRERFRYMLQKMQASDNSPQVISSLIAQASERLDFRKRIFNEGGRCLDYTSAQSVVSTGSNVYIFYFTDAMEQDKEAWETNQDILFNLLRRNSGDYVVVAAECNDKEIVFTKPRVTFYSHYEVVIEDMWKALDFADQCFARRKAAAVVDNKFPPPADRRLVRIPCTRSSCGKEAGDWNCYKCRVPLEYYEGYIYCNCGQADASSYLWQCNSEKHGKQFLEYHPFILNARLKKLYSYKDLNILILGETGVGKSTWVNAFYNYMMFTTLDEAMAHDKLEYVIPSSFSMQYIDQAVTGRRFVQKDVRVGEFNDAEVDGTRGDSGTQKTSVYRIPIRNTVIRLIDTPGVGDVRGVEADRENLASILQTLNRVSSLHGIIILLKPNAARLNLMFRFCVKELLTYLHRDAARNIVWGFTNTRQSNYMPGDSLQPLQRLLQDHQSLGLTVSPDTVFCFDSESFRCLAAKKQAEITMPNQDDFRQSWEYSTTETHRLLAYFSKREPHQVKSTLSLNRARELISQLTKPIADIADIIERTIKLNQQEVEDLKSEKDNRAVLEKSRWYSRIDIEVERLPKPRTVCKNSACVDMKEVGGVRRPIYKSICHDGCSVRGVQEEVVGHMNLIQCRTFGGLPLCRRLRCGHHWQEHMHMYFSQAERVTQAIDQDVEAKLDSQKSIVDVKAEAVSSRRAKIITFQKELKEIRNAAAHFGLFLRRNCIVAYNDAMIRYLDELIKEEQQTIAFHKSNNVPADTNEARLGDLERSRREYQERIKLLEERTKDSTKAKALDEKGVEDFINKLYDLPNWGQSLRDIQSAIEWSKAADFREQVLQPKINRDVLQNMAWINAKSPGAASAADPCVRIKFAWCRARVCDNAGMKRRRENSDTDSERPRKSRKFDASHRVHRSGRTS